MFKKILLTVSVLFAIGFFVKNVGAWNQYGSGQGGLVGGSQGRFMTLVTASSATAVPFPCTVYALHASSAVENGYGNWFVLVDTHVNTSAQNASFGAYSARQKSTKYLFITTGSYANSPDYNSPPWNVRYPLGGEAGIRISTGAAILKNTGGSGEAQNVWVEWGY